MKRIALVALVALLPFSTHAIPPGWMKAPYRATTVTYSLDRHGGLWADTANTNVHVYWDATGIHDTKGNAWTLVGSPTIDNSSGAFFPNGITSAPMYGAGPFLTTAYYQSTNSPGPFAYPGGNFTLCVRFTQLNSAPTERLLAVDGGSPFILDNILGTYGNPYYTQNGTAYSISNAGASYYLYQVGPHVYCKSFKDNGDGTGTMTLQQDLIPELTLTNNGAWTAPTNGTSQIGTASGHNNPFVGIIHEVWGSTDPLTAAQMRTMAKQAFGMILADGTEITDARSTQAKAPGPGGKTWNYSNYVLRIGYESASKYGFMTEPASKNYALSAETHPKTTEASGSLPYGKYVAWHQGTGTLTLAAGTATVTGLSCTTVAAGTLCPFSVTVAGTVLITTTAGTTHVQIEPRSAASTAIVNPVAPGTSVTNRTGDVVTFSAPTFSPGKAFQVQLTAAPYASYPWAQSWSPVLTSFGNPGAPGSARLFLSGTALNFDAYDSGSAPRRVSVAHGFADGSAHALSATVTQGNMSLSADATPVGSMYGYGSTSMSTQTTASSGSDAYSANGAETSLTSNVWAGYVRSLTLTNAKSSLSTTPAADDGIVRIGAQSDTHINTDLTGYIRTARIQMDGWRPDVLAHAGDIGNDPLTLLAEQVEVGYVTTQYGGAPHVFIPGNHDIGSCSGSPCVSKANARLLLPADQQAWLPSGQLYGSTNIQGVHFVALDSEYADLAGTPNIGNVGTAYVPTAELTWLAADIDATSLPVVIVTHRPFRPSEDVTSNGADVRTILDARASKIAVVLSGHTHCPANEVSAAGVFYASVGSNSINQLCSITTHSLGDHVQVEINKAARTARVGWWENDDINGYVEVQTVSHTMVSP